MKKNASLRNVALWLLVFCGLLPVAFGPVLSRLRAIGHSEANLPALRSAEQADRERGESGTSHPDDRWVREPRVFPDLPASKAGKRAEATLHDDASQQAMSEASSGKSDTARRSRNAVDAPFYFTGVGNRFTQAEVDAMENGIDALIAAVESNLATQVYAETLPLVGDNFKAAWDNNVAGFRFLTTIRTQMVTGLSSFNGQPDYDPATVASAIKNRLTTYGGFPTTITVVASTDNDDAQLTFSITRSYVAADVMIEPNVGLPNLKLQLNGTPIARTTVSPTFNFSIGVDGDGLYFQTAGSTLQLNTTTTISALNVPGTFAGLPYSVTRNSTNLTSVPANFTVTLKEPGGDGKLRVGELAGSPDLLDATLTGNTKITLKVDSSFPASAMVPRAGSDLVVLWSFIAHPVDPADSNQAFGGVATLSLENNRVNLDSFFNSFAGEVLDEIASVTAPMGEVIDKLTYPIPLLSDLGSAEVTILDMLGADESTVAAIGGLNALVDLAALASSFTVNPATAVDLGSFSFSSGDLRVDPLEDLLGSATRGPNAQPSQLITFMNDVNAIPGLTFPLLSDPTVVIGVLLGRDATLFAYQSEEAELQFDFQQFYPVMGPLGITLGGEVALKTRFGFGYDTRGIIDYQAGGGSDLGSLLNGFYASAAPDGNGIPFTGITLSASITAGIELNVLVASAGVEGDITATVGFYLNDLAGDELGRIRGSVFNNQPVDEWIFAMGSLSAGLHAYLEIGWPPFGLSFDFDSPRVTLLNYDSRDQNQPVLAEYDLLNPGDLILNVGERAPRRLYGNLDDRAEEFELRVDSGELIVAAFNRENTFNSATRIIGNGNLRGDTLAVAADVLTPVDFSGGDGADILRGGAGNDELSGGNGPDNLNGRSGNDVLRGGDDNDELIAGDGNDTLDGGNGLDAASWMGASIPAVIDLRTASFTGAAAGDTLISIERYKGTGFNDVLDGSDGPDSLLHGLGGDDILRGHAGEDLLEGGPGNDQLDGGPDQDMLIGGTGGDQLDGGDGIDIASYLGAQAPVTASLLTGTGTRGDATGDTLVNIEILMGSGLPKEPGPGFASGDVLEAGTGNAIIYGMDGSDEIRGGSGDDLLYGNHPDIPGIFKPGFDDDDITGGAGNDQLFGQTGDDKLDGGEGADTLLGGPGNDHLITFDTAGIDVLNGEEGINRLSADYSDKVTPLQFTVGAENAFIYPDNDRFEKFQTLGTLRSGSGNDVIRLAAQQEHAFWSKNIDAGAGDDLVIADWRGFYPTGGSGSRTSDILAGGEGVDTVSFEQSSLGVSVNLSTNTVGGAATGMTISGFENVTGTDSADELIGNAENNIFRPLSNGKSDQTGFFPSDWLWAGGGVDTVQMDFSGQAVANVHGIELGVTLVRIPGFLGVNPLVNEVTCRFDSIERFEIIGGDAADTILTSGGAYPDILYGGGGNDMLNSQSGNDLIDGGEGNDVINAGGGNDIVRGGPGNDQITAGSEVSEAGGLLGSDVIDGGTGDDFISDWRGVSTSGGPVTPGAGTILKLDGGPGYDSLTADFSKQTQAIQFDPARPSDHSFPDGSWFRGFEKLVDFVTGEGDDVLIFYGRENNKVRMQGGNDTLVPGLGRDDLGGGDGNDLLILDFSEGQGPEVGPVTSTVSLSNSSSTYRRVNPNTNTIVDLITHGYFERVILTGSSLDDDLAGVPGNDVIYGGPGNDKLRGGGGNDWLDGGPGIDDFIGGPGLNTFVVDNPGDFTSDDSGGGIDTARANVNYTLAPGIENLVLTGTAVNGTGNAAQNVLTGNGLNNYLRGEAQADTLNGGGGPNELDRLNGGASADTFVLGSGGARHYDDGNPATSGHGGYAVIEDFTPSEHDRLRLAGAASEYLLGASPFLEIAGTALYHDSDRNAVLDPNLDELIAIIQSPVALTAANTLTTGSYNFPIDPALVGLDAPLVPTLVQEPGTKRLTIDFMINATFPANVVVEIQSSTDMGATDPWLTISSKTGSGAWSGLSPAISTDAGNGKVMVHAAALQTTSSTPRLFLRVRVSGQ